MYGFSIAEASENSIAEIQWAEYDPWKHYPNSDQQFAIAVHNCFNSLLEVVLFFVIVLRRNLSYYFLTASQSMLQYNFQNC